jgi:predicted permease
MQILSILIDVVVPVFLVAAVGYAWAKRDKPFDPTFVSLMVTVVGTPCLVIDSISKSNLQPSALGTMALAAVLCHFAALGVGYVVLKMLRQPMNVYLPSMTFANTGNMGLPLTLFAFGEAGLALSIGYFTLASLLNFGLGQAIASKNFSPMAILKMPLVWAILLAMVLVTTGLHLPRTIERAMGILGGLTVPLMLVSLGFSLARLKIASLRRGVILSLVRLLGGFAIGWTVGWALGLEGLALGVVVTQSSMPSAVYNYMFAARFGNAEEEVAGMVILSTLLSLIFLPWFLSTVM